MTSMVFRERTRNSDFAMFLPLSWLILCKTVSQFHQQTLNGYSNCFIFLWFLVEARKNYKIEKFRVPKESYLRLLLSTSSTGSSWATATCGFVPSHMRYLHSAAVLPYLGLPAYLKDFVAVISGAIKSHWEAFDKVAFDVRKTGFFTLVWEHSQT